MIAPAFKRTVVGTSRPVRKVGLEGGRTLGRSVVPALLVSALLQTRAATAFASSAPQLSEHYLQYGVGLTAETVAAAGAVCPSNARAPCILGSGVGLAIRFGYRSRGPWYFGGAYEFSRQDSSNLLRLPILQQARAEVRLYTAADRRILPFVAFGLGGVTYGNEWGVDTGGVTAFVGGGVELQISRESVVGAMLGYRPVAFRRWEDSAGQVRADGLLGFGVSHMIGAELAFELRDPLPRW